MSDFESLPEGITINKGNVELNLDLDLDVELVDSIKCDKCNIYYELSLITYASRHEGTIVLHPLKTTVWKNPLSKNKDKAIKNLREAFKIKFDRHIERCNND
jgi:hypothetical protein